MNTFKVDDGAAVLERTPAVFRALLSGLPDTWLTADEGPETFTPFDNLGHLIHGERADWIQRAKIILTQGVNRTFDRYDRFAQTVRVMAKRYREEMGPWTEYLPIVTR